MIFLGLAGVLFLAWVARSFQVLQAREEYFRQREEAEE